MAKMKFDKESLQRFFLNHVEKIVLGVVLLLFVMLVYSGSQREGIDKTPDLLANDVTSAQNHVATNTWTEVASGFPPDQDHKGKLDKGRARTTETFYTAAKTYTFSGKPPAKHRSDPELLAPIEPEARAMVGGLVLFRKEGEADVWADIANMKPKVAEAPKKKKTNPKKTRSPMGEGYADPNQEMSEMMENMMANPEMGSRAMGGRMPGGTATEGATGVAVQADAKKFPGYRPAVGMTAMAAGGAAEESPFIVKPYGIVAVMVKVPYQEQWDAFQKVFKEAEGYNSQRDVPMYLSFQSQKAEVPSDPNGELVWKDNWSTEKVQQLYPKFGLQAFPGEVADPLYVQPGVLTMPLLPVVNRDLAQFAMHSKIPMKETAPTAIAPVTVDKTPTLDLPTDVETLPATDPSTTPAASDPSTTSTTALPGRGMGPGMNPGAMMPGQMRGMMPNMGSMGMGESMGSMGESGGMSGGVAVRPAAEFLMVRFFDFIPPGKKFVYRVRVVLQDPNHPYNPLLSPRDQILADEVKQRLAKVTAEEKTKIIPRIYSVMTPWSEASNPVSADPIRDAYAGGVTAPRTMEIAVGKGIDAKSTGQVIEADGEHKAKVMSVVWDQKLVTDVPALKDVMRGTFLSFQQNVDLVHPLTLTFKTVENMPISVNQLVVDLRGGDALPGVEGETLVSLGETAFFDGQGNLLIRNELDDWEVIDRYSPPVQAASAMPTAGAEAAGESYGAGTEEMFRGGRSGK